MKRTIILIFLGLSMSAFSQDDDLAAMLAAEAPKEIYPVTATFKTTRLINAITIEQVKAGELDFRVAHRFDDIGGKSGGIKTLYGLDNSSDIRISFDYGLTDKICLGFGRSKGAYAQRQLLDFSLKSKLIQQKENGTPVSVSFFASTVITTMPSSTDKYDVTYFENKFTNRLSHTFQLVLARKFSPGISFELIPTYVHRNLVHYTDETGLFALGIGGRIKFTKRFGLIFDYFQLIGANRNVNMDYTPPSGIGFEIETGGHVFHLLFCNNRGLVESQYLTENRSKWSMGQFRFAFNISRTFNVVKNK